MRSRPDSALTILRGIPYNKLTGAAEKARYCLLLEAALDKNDLPLDSVLAANTVRYYSKHGSPDDKMKSWMYLGRYYRRQKNFKQAAISFSHAESFANLAADRQAAGLVYSWLGELYRLQQDDTRDLHYEALSARAFQDAGDSANFNISRAYLALAFQRRQQWALSDSLYEQVLPALSHDTLASSVFISYYAQSKVIRPDGDVDPAYAIALLDRKQDVFGRDWDLTDVSVYALASAMLGDNATCQMLLDLIDRQPLAVQEQASYIKYRIARFRKQYDIAIPLLEATYVRQDSLVSDLLSQSLAQLLKNHYETEALLRQEQLKHQRTWTAFTLMLIVIAAIGACLVLLFRKRQQLAEKDRLLRLSEETNRMLDETLRQHAEKEQGVEATRAILRQRYADMYKKQYEAIGSLCDSYFSQEYSLENRKDRVYAKVSNLLAYISEDKSLHARFEEQINREMDDIIRHLRQDLGELSETNSRVVCYHLIGFSPNTIATILNTSPNAVYIRLSRLRDRIQQLDSQSQERYLGLI